MLYNILVRVKEFSLKNKFLLISLLAFVVIGSLIYPITKSQLQNFVVGQAKLDFQKDVQDKADDSFNLDLPLSLKNNPNINSLVQSVKSETKATNIKLLDSDGAVIYSSATQELGQDFSNQNLVKQAIGGTISAETLDYKNQTLTLWVPIKSSSGEVRAVLYAKTNLPSNFGSINNFTLELDGTIGLLALFFMFATYFVFANAEDDLKEKDHSLVDQSRAFEEEKQLDDAIISSMAESLAVVNKDGQIMLFNPKTEELTGYKSSDVEFRLFRKVLVFCDKDGKEVAKNPILETLKTGQASQISIKDNYYLKNISGTLIPVSASVAPILTKEKKIQGVAVTIQDASAEVELEKVKDEFVYVVAHELGNPIFALDGYLGILQDRSKRDDKENNEILASARSINSQLSELVNDLLEVTRNEQGSLKFDLEPVDLAEIIEPVLKNAQFKAKQKKINLTYQKIKLPKVKAHPQKIKEVITNFIDNAIKYTPNGGKVAVLHKIDGNEVITQVRDNGFGIAPKDQEKLFSKFYRIKTNKTANVSGTGLGLFICRQIVEKCGGRVWAESAEDKGSTFSFALKIAKKN